MLEVKLDHLIVLGLVLFPIVLDLLDGKLLVPDHNCVGLLATGLAICGGDFFPAMRVDHFEVAQVSLVHQSLGVVVFQGWVQNQ